ncbi:GGDEF domain-containing protein [Parasalinivibrio latis]|uniref:diguanylate cyclase domain-containing protein n=1 Tax=Parasalinivibrio latis TaxID=2952610 RepID=UPI0030E0E30F
MTKTDNAFKNHEATTQEKLVNFILTLGSAYAVLVMIITTVRATEFGFDLVYFVDLLTVVAVCAVAVCRHRIKTRPKAYLVIFIICTNFFTNFVASGPMAGSTVLFPLSIFVVAMIFKKRTTVRFIKFVAVSISLLAYVFSQHLLTTTNSLDTLIRSETHWLVYVFCMIMFFVVTGYALHTYREEHRILIDKLQRQQEMIEWQANHDNLTGLPNYELAQRYFDQVQQSDYVKATVLFIDLDGFKKVNDTYGHDTGDHCLKVVARRMRRHLPETDLVCRVGGDEFLIVLNHVNNEIHIDRIVDRILDALNDPITHDEHSFHIGASIGIAVVPNYKITLDHIRTIADQAMYDAKRQGKNQAVYA